MEEPTVAKGRGLLRNVPVRLLLVVMVLIPWLGLAFFSVSRIDHDLSELTFTNRLRPALAEVQLFARVERELHNEGGSAALKVAVANAGYPLDVAEMMSGVPIRSDLVESRKRLDGVLNSLGPSSAFRREHLALVRKTFDSRELKDPYHPGYTELRAQNRLAIETSMRQLWVLSAQLGDDVELVTGLRSLEVAVRASDQAVAESNLLLHRSTGSPFEGFGLNLINEAHAATLRSLRALAELESTSGSTLAKELLLGPDQKAVEAEVVQGAKRSATETNSIGLTRELYRSLAHRNASLVEVSDSITNRVSLRARSLAAVQRSAIRHSVLWLSISLIGTLTLAFLVALSILRPLNRLGQQALSLVEGKDGLQPLILSGPPELLLSAQAFNELATTLSAVQLQADDLANGNLEGAAAQRVAPNRLSSSVQKAVQRLSESIQQNNQLRDDFAYAAAHDALTGLPNRSAIYSLLEGHLAAGEAVGLLFVDLDHFKGINDVHGHHAGDQVLRGVSERFAVCADNVGVVGRLGGDEFVVVCSPRVEQAGLADLADRMIAAASVPLQVGPITLTVGASAGIAIGEPEDTASSLLLRADEALYQAKADGRNSVVFAGKTYV